MFNLICIILLVGTVNADDGKGASAGSTEVSVGCFAGDSFVHLTNGEQKSIDSLQTGDEILVVNHFKVNPSEMMMMLDKEKSKQARFYTFLTASNHQLSLTGLHLIPILSSLSNQIDYIAARDVQLGDQFYVHINGQLKLSPVTNITIEMKRGYYAPLTLTGTILVNNVYASCFASVNDHQLAQLFMTPFRWYYHFTRWMSIIDPFDNHRIDGIHWFIQWIYQSLSYIQPFGLQLS